MSVWVLLSLVTWLSREYMAMFVRSEWFLKITAMHNHPSQHRLLVSNPVSYCQDCILSFKVKHIVVVSSKQPHPNLIHKPKPKNPNRKPWYTKKLQLLFFIFDICFSYQFSLTQSMLFLLITTYFVSLPFQFFGATHSSVDFWRFILHSELFLADFLCSGSGMKPHVFGLDHCHCSCSIWEPHDLSSQYPVRQEGFLQITN